MNRLIFYVSRSRFLINRLTEYIKDSSKCILANRYRDWGTCCHCIHTANQTICRSHGNTSYDVITQMLCDFHNQLAAVFSGNFDGFIDFRQVTFRIFYVQNRTDNLSDFSYIFCCHFFTPLSDSFRSGYNFC